MTADMIWQLGGHVIRVDGSPSAHHVQAACSCGWTSHRVHYHWALKQADSHLDAVGGTRLSVDVGGDDVHPDRLRVDLDAADHLA